jgi:hypothetical protein
MRLCIRVCLLVAAGERTHPCCFGWFVNGPSTGLKLDSRPDRLNYQMGIQSATGIQSASSHLRVESILSIVSCHRHTCARAYTSEHTQHCDAARLGPSLPSRQLGQAGTACARFFDSVIVSPRACVCACHLIDSREPRSDNCDDTPNSCDYTLISAFAPRDWLGCSAAVEDIHGGCSSMNHSLMIFRGCSAAIEDIHGGGGCSTRKLSCSTVLRLARASERSLVTPCSVHPSQARTCSAHQDSRVETSSELQYP